MLTRCGVNADRYYNDADYEHIYDFSTPQTLSVLGNAVSDISRILLLELGKLARSLPQDAPQRQLRRKPAAPRRPAPKGHDRAEPVEKPAPATQSNPEPEPEAAAVSGSDIPGATAPELPAPVESEAATETVKPRHLPLGTTVYIGSKEYVLVAYGDNSVTLCEPDCPLFQDVMPCTEFDAKVAENPLNEHLLTEQRNHPAGDRDPGHHGTGRAGAAGGSTRSLTSTAQTQKNLSHRPAPGNPGGTAA